MFLSSILALIAALAPAQDKPATPSVSVPAYPNVSCPIMGKPISRKLFVDTELGRVWVCCKSCNKDVLEDPKSAFAAAYPTIEKVANTVCPVSGEAIGKDAQRVTLQGFEFSVASKAHVEKARASSQIVLAKVQDPKLVDVGNRSCPVTGEVVGDNSFAVIDGSIVHLSSDKVLDDVRKEPLKALAKAKEIAAKQPKTVEATPQPQKPG